MDADGNIGVIASRSGAAVTVAELRARMPHEDIVVSADHGHPAWPSLRGERVCARVQTMAQELCAGGAKVIVVASLQGTLDGLETARASVPVAVVGLDVQFAVQRVLTMAPGRPVAIVAVPASARAPQLQGVLKRVRSGGMDVLDPDAGAYLGYGGLVLAGAATSERSAEIAAAATPGTVVVDTAAVAAAQAHRLIARSAALARRRRPGRTVLQSSFPARA